MSTSGTSGGEGGHVRWIALAKDAFLASARAVNAHLQAGPTDIWAHALPLFHVGGLGILARAWLAGAKAEPALAGRWSASAFHDAVVQSGATLTALVPSQVHDLVAAGLASPPALRAVIVGGARLEPSLYASARALGWPCLPSYGLTEACSQVATAAPSSLSAPEYPERLPILPHAAIRVGGDGRLSIRATSLLTCCAEFDGEVVRTWDPKRDGWLETDDTGLVSDGCVEVFGRASDFVKVLGEKVSLLRVEERAWQWADRHGLRSGEAFDLAVVGAPHARRGHELVLALAVAEHVDQSRREELAASLADFCREALLPFERIQRVAWVREIPRTPLGKCRRVLLARQVGEQAGSDRRRD